MPEESAVIAQQTVAERWARVAVKPVYREDRLPEADAVRKWSAIYVLFDASGESAQDEAYVAVTGYFLHNGCSPYGKYSRPIETGGGTKAMSADVVRISGRLEGEIRQFLRAHMKKSYETLKYSPLAKDEVLRQLAESQGIPRDKAFLLADWLEKCEYFTPEEQELYTSVRYTNIRNARAQAIEAPDPRAQIANERITPAPPTPVSQPAGYIAQSY